MSEWYWRNGERAVTVGLDDPQWREQMVAVDKKLGDIQYKAVKQETLQNGKWISTVWLGLNHRFGAGTPLIFETMVFPSKGEFSELDAERYSTEAEAIAGHELLKAKWSNS